MKWYKIASHRTNSKWWDEVLAPLKELESRATDDIFSRQEGSNEHEKTEAIRLPAQSTSESLTELANFSSKSTKDVLGVNRKKLTAESSAKHSTVSSRSTLEDMELQTRALTEPLPTNQQVLLICTILLTQYS